MKKHLQFFAIAFLLSLAAATSQNVNYASHAGINLSGGMVSINSKSYYIERIKSLCCHDKVYITAIDASGQTLFSKELTISGADHLKKIIKTVDDHLIVLGVTQPACDVMGSKDFIARIDTNGVELYKTIITGFSNITDIADRADTTVLLSSNSLLINYSKTGQYLSDVDPGITGIRAILSLTNNHVLINGKINSIQKNVEYDVLSNSILSQQNSMADISKFFQSSSGKIIALSGSASVFSYNSNLTYINMAPLPLNLRVMDFVCRGDSVFITGVNAAINKPFYSILGGNLNVLYHTQPNYKLITPTGISLNNKNRINIITTGSSEVYTNVTFKGLFQFDMDGQFESDPDIGVIGVSGANSVMKNAGTALVLVPDLAITIKNYGVDTVKSFFLNNYMHGYQLCYNLFHQLYTTPIAPNQSIVVQTGTFMIHPYFSTPPNTNSGSADVYMCFFTSIPNGKNDIEIENDALCDEVLFTVTGIKENELLAQSIKIFPNPFENNFSVKSSEIEMKSVQIFNSLGLLVRDEIINAKDYAMDTSTFKSGVYVVRIETEKGTINQKLLRQ